MAKPSNPSAQYPYGRLKGMKDFMAFAQDKDWKPARIDLELLKKLDIAKGKEREAIKTLNFLGLIDEEGTLTLKFDALKSNYQGTLKELVQTKYAALFALIPPRMINQARLVKFFDTAVDTAEYQAKLFVWLCEQAGIELPNVEKNFHRARFDKEKETE